MYTTLNAFKATFGIETVEYDSLIMHYIRTVSGAIDKATLTNFTGLVNYNDQIFGNNTNFVPIGIWSSLTTVVLKTFGNTTGQTLVQNVDFLAQKIPGETQIYALKFFNRTIASNQFFDITGTFSFNYLPTDIENILFNCILTVINSQATKVEATNNEQTGAVGTITSVKNLSSSINYSVPDSYLLNAEKIANGNLLAVPEIADVLLKYKEYSKPTTITT